MSDTGSKSQSILVIGNYCHDTLLNTKGQFEVLGGSAAYISAALEGLGAHFHVISKVGRDFKYMDQTTHDPLVTDALTTHFIDDFRTGERTSKILNECDPITAMDFEGTSHSRIGILCGVASEILPETVLAAREVCDILIADIQGLIRAKNPATSQVELRPLSETRFSSYLGHIDYLKVSESELPFYVCPDLTQSPILLITRGPKGCQLIDQRPGFEHSLFRPAPEAKEIDSTGAGDSWLAGFAFSLAQDLAPGFEERALELANRLGAYAVQTVGVPDFKKFRAEL